jgi:hypothetical protein
MQLMATIAEVTYPRAMLMGLARKPHMQKLDGDEITFTYRAWFEVGDALLFLNIDAVDYEFLKAQLEVEDNALFSLEVRGNSVTITEA